MLNSEHSIKLELKMTCNYEKHSSLAFNRKTQYT